MQRRAINVIKCTTLRTDSTNTYDTCFEIGIIAYKNKMIGRSTNNGKWSIKPSSCILVGFVSSENMRNNTVIQLCSPCQNRPNMQLGNAEKNLLIHILCINKHRKKGRSNPTTFAVTFVEVLVRSKFGQLVCHCWFSLLNFIFIFIYSYLI